MINNPILTKCSPQGTAVLAWVLLHLADNWRWCEGTEGSKTVLLTFLSPLMFPSGCSWSCTSYFSGIHLNRVKGSRSKQGLGCWSSSLCQYPSAIIPDMCSSYPPPVAYLYGCKWVWHSSSATATSCSSMWKMAGSIALRVASSNHFTAVESLSIAINGFICRSNPHYIGPKSPSF